MKLMKYSKRYSVIVQLENIKEVTLFAKVLELASSQLKTIMSKEEKEALIKFMLDLIKNI